MKEKPKLMDCHVHLDEMRFISEEGARLFGKKVGDLIIRDVGIEKHLEHIRKDNIEREYCIFENPKNLIALRREAGGCDVRGMFFVRNPNNPDITIIENLVSTGLVSAIKIHPVMDCFELTGNNIGKVLTLARRLKLPILFHSDDRKLSMHLTEPSLQRRIVSENPDVTFIMGHGGAYAHPRLIGENEISMRYWEGLLSRRRLILEALKLSLEKDNVYYDLSICTNKIKAGLISDFVNKHPLVSEKILVGTDYPINFSSAQSQTRALNMAGIKDRYLDQIVSNRI